MGAPRKSLLGAAAIFLGGFAFGNFSALGDTSPDHVSVGVIRWDFWFKGNPTAQFLSWDRVPFFTSYPDGKMVMAGDDQVTMDREIGYAKAGGIDYFIFNYYNDYTVTGVPSNAAIGRRSLSLYLSSRRRAEMHFALAVGSNDAGPMSRWPATMASWVDLIAMPEYQRVADGRPVVYFFWDISWWNSLFKSYPGGGQGALDDFRRAVLKRTGKNPYFVALNFFTKDTTNADGSKTLGGPSTAKMFGLDAVSSYANPLGANGRDVGYAACASLNAWFRAQLLETGAQIIPIVNTGWDPRPIAGRDPYGVRPLNPDYCDGTPEQIAANLQSAVQWTQAHPSNAGAHSVIVYAWDELAEGGWLVPTLKDGHARLDSIRNALVPGAASEKMGDLDGWIDSVTLDQWRFQVRGWACFKGSSASIDVRLNFGGTDQEGGVGITNWHADEISEPAVLAACGPGGSHRFLVDLPADSVQGYHGKAITMYGWLPGRSSLLPGSGRLSVP